MHQFYTSYSKLSTSGVRYHENFKYYVSLPYIYYLPNSDTIDPAFLEKTYAHPLQ